MFDNHSHFKGVRVMVNNSEPFHFQYEEYGSGGGDCISLKLKLTVAKQDSGSFFTFQIA